MIPIPSCRLLLAPTDGRVAEVSDTDTDVDAGEVVATLETPSGVAEVVAREAGRVGGLLVQAGRIVRRGTPVAWLTR